jgi:hypothetical protein
MYNKTPPFEICFKLIFILTQIMSAGQPKQTTILQKIALTGAKNHRRHAGAIGGNQRGQAVE